uniref:Uncharacterized protein n=1 Tax=Siphoviridae sp. ct16M3 TaxID=2825305 RepID=A0A8S5PPH6_9CAUD|nr:MAG TPA: hypothetical protein [Siphoviridae sp. ct16M3]DAM84997.1 MAG TPA: hypothetical protein [Caudoviricetes sp.]
MDDIFITYMHITNNLRTIFMHIKMSLIFLIKAVG